MNSSQELISEISGTICTITINREAKRNAVTPEMLLRLAGTLEDLREADVYCVVIRGAGEKAFSAGYDISSIGKQEGEMMRDYRDDHPLVIANKAIESFPYPVIAMINGHAFGGALELALACDIRIAADHALYAMPPAKLGIIYPYSGIRKFINLIGLGNTKELFLSARTIDAERAKEIGLVNHVLPKNELEEFTLKMAEDITANAPLSLETMKYIMNSWQRSQALDPAEEQRVKELILLVDKSEDYKEGQKAFAEKRKPVFKGS